MISTSLGFSMIGKRKRAEEREAGDFPWGKFSSLGVN